MPKIFQFYIDSFKGLSKDTWLLALVLLINRSGLMVVPFLSLYITQELGWSKTQAGVVIGCFGVGALAGSNLGGWLSDRIGTYRVMLMSLFSAGAAFALMMFFKEFYSLCFWVFLTSLVASAFTPAAFLAVSEYSKEDNVTRGISLLRMAINMGIAIGPAIGGFMANQYNYDWLFILDGGTCITAGFFLMYSLGHRKQSTTKKRDMIPSKMSPYRDILIIAFLLFCLFNLIAFFQILFSIPVYFSEEILLTEAQIGWFFTVNGLLIVIFEMPIIFQIEASKKIFTPMIYGAVMIGLGYCSLSVFPVFSVAIVFYMLLVSFGEIINFPLIAALALKKAAPEDRGKYMGLVSMMFSSAYIFAPLLGLPIIEIIGFNPYWYFAGGMSILSGLCLYLLRPHFLKALKN